MSEESEFQHYTKLDTRLGKVERDITALASQMAHASRSIDSFGESLSSLSREMKDSSKFDWKNLAAWFSVLLAVIGGIGVMALVPLRADLDEVASELRYNRINRYEEIKQDGIHTEKIAAMERNLTHLDEVLQREMRILDDKAASALNEQVKALDVRLQNEMRLINQITERRVDGLERFATGRYGKKSSIN